MGFALIGRIGKLVRVAKATDSCGGLFGWQKMRSKKEKLSLSDQTYWKNLFQYYLIIVGAVVLFSFKYEDGIFDLSQGFFLVSIGAVVILGHRIAYSFSNEKKLEDKNQS